MNKYLAAFVMANILIVSGCESLSNAQSISSGDFSDMSCEQIQNVFTSYKNDKTTLDGLLAIAGMSIASMPGNATEAQMYAQARGAANIALTVKGCGTSV